MITILKTDQMQARKNKDTLKTDLLTTLISEIQKKAKDDKNRDVTNDDCISVIRKFLNNSQEVLKFRSSDDTLKEIEILNSYLPQQLNEQEMRQIVLSLIEQYPAIKIGDVMNHFRQYHSGQFDGKLLLIVVKEHVK